MGYPVEMIGTNTALFSIIGTDAIENKKDSVFNNYFKNLDVDCKMMPLNIRQDDIGFFLNGLKDSQIKAVYFEKEYWEQIVSLLECDNEEINFCGICDTIDIEDNNYTMRLSIGKAIVDLLGDIDSKTVVIVGSSNEAKSTLFNLIKKNPAKIILAEETIEELMDMMSIIPKTLPYEIVRIQNNNISEDYDMCINFMDNILNCNINYNDNFDKILDKIAKTNTKNWSDKWKI